MATFASPLLAALNARVTYANVSLQGVPTSAFTLDGALSLWSYKAIQTPASMGGAAPADAAAAFAASYCYQWSPPDCVNSDSLAAQYGAIVAAALAGLPIPAFPPIPNFTGLTVGTGAGFPAAPAYDPNAVAANVAAAIAAAGTPAAAPTTPPATTVITPPAPTFAPTPTGPPAGTSVPVTTGKGVTPKFIAAGGALLAGAAGGPIGLAIVVGVAIVGTILGGLFGGLFGGSDTKALQQAVNQLRQALAQTADELERFSWQIARGLGRLWQAVAEIWDNFLDSIWTYLKQLWNLLSVLVSQVIPKIINVLRDLRKFLDSIYLKYILPAIRYLQLVRQVLSILRALHVPIAARLDKILGEIQAALYVPLLALAEVVGGYGAWINVMLSNRYLIQRPVFLRSMWAYQADWISMFWAAQTASHGAVGLPLSAGAGVPSNDAAIAAEVKLYATTGTGPMAADVAQAQAMMAATLAGNL